MVSKNNKPFKPRMTVNLLSSERFLGERRRILTAYKKASFKLDSLIKEKKNLITNLPIDEKLVESLPKYHQRHLLRVALISIAIGRQLNLTEKQLNLLGFSAFYHDIGKKWISPLIIEKAGPLTNEEMNAMKQHPKYSANAIKNFIKENKLIERKLISKKDALEIENGIRFHHENMDGTGYNKLKPNDQRFNLFAKIIRLADDFDALRMQRSYKKKWTYAEAKGYLKKRVNERYDANVWKAFDKVTKDILISLGKGIFDYKADSVKTIHEKREIEELLKN